MSKAWEAAIKKAIEKNPELACPAPVKKRITDYYGELLRKYMIIPLAIGVTASIVSYNIYGGAELAKKFLDWIIGITLFATLYALISKKNK
jgi:hypothetical protein